MNYLVRSVTHTHPDRSRVGYKLLVYYEVFGQRRPGIEISVLVSGVCESVTNIQKIAFHTIINTVHIQKYAECQFI